jgi:hypothetical protein
MNSRFFLGCSGFARNAFLKLYLSGLILAGAASTAAQAQSILAGARLSGVLQGRSGYAYTLTLQNTPASTADIGMFWFAWQSGEADFLTSEPTSIQTPDGWTSVVEGGGGGDGYSIQFITFTTPLTPGSSVSFNFDSPDPPRIMAGPASFYPEFATLTSQVYSGHAADGLQEVFVVQLVQAPVVSAVLGEDQNLRLTWSGGQAPYQVQTATDLVNPAWQNLGAPTTNTSLLVITTNAAAFYRVKSQ